MEAAEPGTETRERLLDAAEVLFAEKGFEAVSLREITGRAQANVAAVNYHFGGKEKLMEAVMARHAGPINEERRRRLEELLAGEKRPSVREVLDAFLGPMVERIRAREGRQKLFAQFMGRMIGEGACGLPDELIPQFQEMARLVVKAIQSAVPKLDAETAYCRMKIVFAVLADSMVRDPAFDQISKGLLDDWDWERRYEEVMKFCVEGMNA